VSQISPPIRILVVLAIAVTGIYMLFLRPKPEVVPAAEPAPNTQTAEPAVSGPGKVAEAAQGAVEASNDQLSAQEGVDGVDAGESAAGTTGNGSGTAASSDDKAAAAAAAVAEDLKGLPKPVRQALRKNKVLVLLFWNGKSADDKAVRAAMKKVDRWDGRVSVQVANIKKISKYGRISRGVDVEQSPTIVVTGPDLNAETLVGYVDTTTIDQTVVDAFRNTTGLFTSTYLRGLHSICTRGSNVVAKVPGYYVGTSVKQLDVRIARFDVAVKRFVNTFKAVKAPKQWRAYHAASAADLAAFAATVSKVSASVTPKSSHASVGAAVRTYEAASTPVGKRMNKRFGREGLFRCGTDF